MNRILLGTTAIVGLLAAGSAGAADLARAPVYKAPPAMVAPYYNWTGFYVGGYVGGAWGNNVRVTNVNTADTWNYDLGSSFIGGGTAGLNYQIGQWVWGVEGEVGYIHLTGSAADPLALTNVSSSRVGDAFGVIAGRLGFAWDRALLYVKGGGAFVDVNTNVAVSGVTIATGGNTLATYAIGGGLEYGLWDNWSVKAEYLYLGLHETVDAVTAGGANTFHHDFDGISTAKLGLNYRFNWGGPVVARY